MHFSKTAVKWEEKQKCPSKCAASVDLFWIGKLILLTILCYVSVHHCFFISICLVKAILISLLERNAEMGSAAELDVKTKRFVSTAKSHLLHT